MTAAQLHVDHLLLLVLGRLRKRVDMRSLGVGIRTPQMWGLLRLLVLLLIGSALALLLLSLLVHLLLLAHLLLLIGLLLLLLELLGALLRLLLAVRLLLAILALLLVVLLLLVGLLQGESSGSDDVDLAAVALLAGRMGWYGVGRAGNRRVLVGVGQVLRHVLRGSSGLVPKIVIHFEYGPIVHFRHRYLQRR